MATLFEAYVTNAGKYSEGQLVGETLKFPTTAQEVEALLKRIGVDGVRYQEIFITSFDGDVLGLYDHLSEYENLDELNHLACLLSELTSSELETLEAVLDSGDHCSSVRDIINLTQNLDCYGFYPGVSDEETLGRIYVDDLEMLDVPDQVKPYFDYEAYGRDVCIHENGHFAPGGYVVKESDHFVEVYHGLQDIPKEHKVFSFPKLSIRAASKKVTLISYWDVSTETPRYFFSASADCSIRTGSSISFPPIIVIPELLSLFASAPPTALVFAAAVSVPVSACTTSMISCLASESSCSRAAAGTSVSAGIPDFPQPVSIAAVSPASNKVLHNMLIFICIILLMIMNY